MNVHSGSKVEVQLPSRLGFEKVAMSTAAGMAKLMGFSASASRTSKPPSPRPASTRWSTATNNASIPVSVVLSMKADELEVKVMDNGTGMDTPAPTPDIDRKMSGEEDARNGHVSHPGPCRRGRMGVGERNRPAEFCPTGNQNEQGE